MKRFLACIVAVIFIVVANAQNKDYKSAAMNLYKNIQANFYIIDSGYYREEAKGKHTENPISFLWPLCAMIQAGNEMDVAFSSNKYLNSILNVIQKYRDTRPPASGYASYKLGNKIEDRYYDDNQWIGIACLDAYSRTKNNSYLTIGKEIYNFMMSGYDTISGGGIYWVENKKESKNTCSNGPGILVALGMYNATKDKRYLDTAKLIYEWTNQHLKSPNGLYYDNYNVKKHRIDSARYSYNAGTMLESSIWLYQLTKEEKYLKDAQQTASSAAIHFLKNGIFKDDYWFNAVLLRGYVRLYNYDHNPNYISLFKTCIDNTLNKENHPNGLFGKEKVDNLVGQGGLLEMLCRLYTIK